MAPNRVLPTVSLHKLEITHYNYFITPALAFDGFIIALLLLLRLVVMVNHKNAV